MASQQNIEVLTTVPFPDAVVQQLRGLSPRSRITFNPATKVEEIPNEVWQRTEVLYTDILLPALALVPNLKWVQFHYAGIDFVQGSDLAQPGRTEDFTSMKRSFRDPGKGIHPPDAAALVIT